MLKKIKAWMERHEIALRTARKITFILLGSLLTADTIFASKFLSGNIGAYLPAIIGLPLIILGALDAPLRRFFRLKWGRARKYCILLLCFAMRCF